MGDVLEFAYAALVLAVPFMFGIAVGRGIRPAPESLEHRFGQKIICALEDVRTTRKIVGEGVIVQNTATVRFADNRDVKITVEAA